jgi:hypothetical protein
MSDKNRDLRELHVVSLPGNDCFVMGEPAIKIQLEGEWMRLGVDRVTIDEDGVVRKTYRVLPSGEKLSAAGATQQP